MINGINPFIILVDKDGDVIDTMSAKSVIDDVFAVLRHLNKEYPDYAPHFALEWQDGYFKRVEDYSPTSSATRAINSIKVKLLPKRQIYLQQLANATNTARL
jgi:hypothetical protein